MLYLDSSAIVKLVAAEPETSALVKALRSDPATISSALARVEVIRALKRSGASSARAERASEVLERIALVPADGAILERASVLEPRDLRSFDAIHLATALLVRDDLAGLVTYDLRLADAAVTAHLSVLAPS